MLNKKNLIIKSPKIVKVNTYSIYIYIYIICD